MNPPWIKYLNLSPDSMGWRMGAGEDYREQFDEWWAEEDAAEREAYAQSYPEPVAWAGFWKSLPNRYMPSSDGAGILEGASAAVEAAAAQFHHHRHFRKHCEIAALLLNREDRNEPAVKHHIREALREASDLVAKIPGDKKQTAQYMSKDALVQMQGGNSEGLIGEHIFPVSLLNVLVLDDAQRRPVTTESIAKILAGRTLRAVITNAEDDKLGALGLHKTMPEGSVDPKARYAAAGIELVPNQYSALSKLCK
jgi:hypothetical protein